MVKIYNNSDHQIKDIYKNCITLGDVHILKDLDSLNEIINYSKNIINKHFGDFKNVQNAQEKLNIKDYIEIIMKIKNDFTNSNKTNEIIKSLLKKLNLQNKLSITHNYEYQKFLFYQLFPFYLFYVCE